MDEQVLIWRQPIPSKHLHPARRLSTTILARGSYDEMIERWTVADRRLRAFKLPGHVSVRSADDPRAIADLEFTSLQSRPTPRWRPVPSGTPDQVASRLALLPGDRVAARIYGNLYSGTVRSITRTGMGCTVQFNALTKHRGGWGGEPAARERPFPVWVSNGSRGIEAVSRQQRREQL